MNRLRSIHIAYKWPVVFLLVLISCALPTQEIEEQSFVSEEELRIVSLVREGLDYFKRGRYSDAQFKFWRASLLAPTADNIKLNLAMSLRQQGVLEEAESLLTELVEQEPENDQYLVGLAGVYLEELDYSKAYKLYQKAYNLALEQANQNTMVQLLKSMTVIAFRIGDIELARCQAALAYELSGDIDTIVSYVQLLLAESDFQSAQKILSDYRSKVKKEDARILYYQSLALFVEGAYVDVFRLKSTTEFSASYDLVKTEHMLLLAVTKRLLDEQGRLSEVADLLPAPDPDQPEEEDPLMTLYGGKALEIAERIFWPYELLIPLERFIVETQVFQ